MRAATRLQTAIGVAGALLLLALVLFPELVPVATLPHGIELPTTDEISNVVAGALALATVAFVLASQVGSKTEERRVDPLATDPPEEIHGRATGYPRPDVDAAFDGLVDEDDGDAVASLSADLRAVAVRIYAAEAGRSRDDAADGIEAGEWTDDARAAAFVARDPDPLPLRSRLWDYVRSENADHRRARHAVEALESLTASGELPPATDGERPAATEENR